MRKKQLHRMKDKSNDNVIINTQGGPVITGGTFVGTEFVANKYVYDAPVPVAIIPEDEAIEEKDILNPLKADADINKKRDVRTGGRRKAHLFMDANGIKDENLTMHNVAAFTGFLAQHHSTSSVLLETKKDNYIAKVFVSFYRRWMNNGCVERTVNGSACYRFLTEDCGLPCATTEKTFSNWIKLKIKEDDADIILDGSIENYIRENNSYA